MCVSITCCLNRFAQSKAAIIMLARVGISEWWALKKNLECLQSRTVLASSAVPACKDGPALQRSNSGVTAYLARPDLEQLLSAGGSALRVSVVSRLKRPRFK